jgi:hypothetical protein
MVVHAEVVTVHVWRVPVRHVVPALGFAAGDRGRVRSFDGAIFAKLLGTSRGLSIRDAAVTRWMLLAGRRSGDAEELFARFGVLGADGSLAGQDPMERLR